MQESKFDHAVRTVYKYSQSGTQHEHLQTFRRSTAELSEGTCPQCHEPMKTTTETISGPWGVCKDPTKSRCLSLKRIITDERGTVQQALYPDFLVETFEVKSILATNDSYVEIGGKKIPFDTSELELIEVHCRVIDIHPPNKAMEIRLGSDAGLKYKVKSDS